MDAMQNDSANATGLAEAPDGAQGAGAAAAAVTEAVTEAAGGQPATEPVAGEAETESASAPESPELPGSPESAEGVEGVERAEAVSAEAATSAPEPVVEPSSTSAEVPQQRTVETESASGKGKKRKSAPKPPKSAVGTKSLVVLREGRVHYADETVVVLDLDDAAHPDTDVHDVVDKLSELRDAIESSGRVEAVALVAELIQAKALA